ncbi:MAG: cysteine desulfurase [Lewinellaceae bacterium]|nr:cysteine desulfurase [Lewinellaceae bacterium]
MLDPATIRQQFPLFSHYPRLAYLDNAATTQKPKSVIDAITNFYEKGNANIHRGVYELAVRATHQYEGVRGKVAALINAPKPETIVYTAGTTAGINLVAQSFLEPNLQAGDEVVISFMEHHANLIPWQMACKEKGAKLRVIPMSKDGVLDMKAYKEMLSPRTRMLALVHVSNTLGTVNPIEEMIALAHRRDIPVLVDGAQSIAHFPIDVQALDVDFFAFSGHKMFGPTGVGILYGKEEHLAAMPPWQFGGDMIRDVAFEETTFAEAPQRFEAGTTPIAGVIGLGAAVGFLQALDNNEIQQHLKKLGRAAREKLARIDGLRIIGNAENSTATVSFVLEGVHPHDVATFLAEDQVAVRAGHHCTQPIMDFFEIAGTTRASFSIYNEMWEVEQLAESLENIRRFFLA